MHPRASQVHLAASGSMGDGFLHVRQAAWIGICTKAGSCHAKNTCTTHRQIKALEAAEELMDFLKERYLEAMDILDNAKDDMT